MPLDTEQQELPGTQKGYKEWPVYKSEEQREDEQVEYVYGLTGGELNDGKSPNGHAYWYDGAPEYAEDIDTRDGTYFTTLTLGGGFLPHPTEEFTDPEGQVWKLVGTYMSSGETDCPVCGPGSDDDQFRDGFIDAHGEEPQPTDRCGLCETEVKDMPGHIYIGEGYEAVYQLVEDPEGLDDEEEEHY